MKRNKKILLFVCGVLAVSNLFTLNDTVEAHSYKWWSKPRYVQVTKKHTIYQWKRQLSLT